MASMLPYSIAILSISLANLVLAAIAYLQRAKQIRGNALRGAKVTETGSSRKRAIHLADSCWEYPETCLYGLRHIGWMRLAAH